MLTMTKRMCLECPASLACTTGRVVIPKRCTRCKCVEATLQGRNAGSEGIFRVAFGCPRAAYMDGGYANFYCQECAQMVHAEDINIISHSQLVGDV